VPAPDRRRFSRRPARTGRTLGLGFCLVAALLARPAVAEDERPDEQLKAVEKALDEGRKTQARYAKEAETLAAELARLRDSSVTAAQAVQAREAAITGIEDQLAQLAADEERKVTALQARAQQYDEFLMALQRLARNPPEALALAPGEPVDATRSALLLGAAIPQIEAKARELQAEIAALAVARKRTAEKRHQLVGETAELAKQQLVLNGMIARKASLQEQATHSVEITAQRLQQLSAQAGDLRELIESIEAAPAASRGAAALPGRRTIPRCRGTGNRGDTAARCGPRDRSRDRPGAAEEPTGIRRCAWRHGHAGRRPTQAALWRKR